MRGLDPLCRSRLPAGDLPMCRCPPMFTLGSSFRFRCELCRQMLRSCALHLCGSDCNFLCLCCRTFVCLTRQVSVWHATRHVRPFRLSHIITLGIANAPDTFWQ